MYKRKYNTWIIISCLIGLVLSLYATYVEINSELDRNYRALCDISARISCTKVFSSRYGKGFGLLGHVVGEESKLNQPNGFMGVMFYIFIGLLCLTDNVRMAKAQVILCVVSNLLSLYLAYLLYFVLEDFCVVCVSTYVVNFTNLLLTTKRYQLLRRKDILAASSSSSSSSVLSSDTQKVD